MNYTTNEQKDVCAASPVPKEPLTVIMNETSSIAAEILTMTRSINGHMFGTSNSDREKEAAPRCFLDELEKTRYELQETARELGDMCSLLGL